MAHGNQKFSLVDASRQFRSKYRVSFGALCILRMMDAVCKSLLQR